jgi:hypothetical protein
MMVRGVGAVGASSCSSGRNAGRGGSGSRGLPAAGTVGAGRAAGAEDGMAGRAAGAEDGTRAGAAGGVDGAASGAVGAAAPGARTAGIPVTVLRALRTTRPFDHNSSVPQPSQRTTACAGPLRTDAGSGR